MTNTETIQDSMPWVIPGFSAINMKREAQERIYRETEGMTAEEVREYFRKGSESFDRRCEAIRAQQVASHEVKSSSAVVST